MSDFFSNKSSEIPDEIWKAPAPMQRQVDAAVLWAELTGKHQEEELPTKEAAFYHTGMGLGAGAGAIIGAHKAQEGDNLAKRIAIGAGAGALGGGAGFHAARLAAIKTLKNERLLEKVRKLSEQNQELFERAIVGGVTTGAPAAGATGAALLADKLTKKRNSTKKEAAFPLAGMIPGAITGAAVGAAKGNDKDSLAKRMAIGAGAGALGGSAGFHGSRLALGKVLTNPTVVNKIEKLGPTGQNLVMGGAVLGAGLAAPAAGGAGATLLADKLRNKKTKKEASALSKMVSGVANSPVAAGAAIGAPAGAAIEYAEARPGKKGLSRREINLRGQLASLREQEKITGNKGGKIDRLKRRLEKAEEARKNPAKAALKGAAHGAAFGSLGGYLGGKGLL